MTVYCQKVPSVPLHELEALPHSIVALGREYPSGHLVERDRHDRPRLIYGSKGLRRLDPPARIWVVPPMHAIWVPATVQHELRASSTVHLRTLFIKESSRTSLPRECCVVEVSPLLRELILRMVNLLQAPGSP